MRNAHLTPLEDSIVRYVLAHAHEGGGWLDLTRICSHTGRMLPDVREAALRLAKRKILKVDETAPETRRWLKFVVEPAGSASSARPAPTPIP
jgi:hypothetical protein